MTAGRGGAGVDGQDGIAGVAPDLAMAGDGGPPPYQPCPLELRYRRWLRVLPKAYRTAREQEMVDTFLDSEFLADPENADLTAKFGSVGWSEAVSVLALALRLRWTDLQGPPRFRVRAVALPLVALSFLTVLAVTTAVSLCSRLWLLVLPPEDLAISPLELAFGTASGFWPFLTAWSFVLWIPALAVALTGARRATSVAALLSAVPAAVTLIEAVQQPGVGLHVAFDWVLALVQWSVVVALAATGRTAPYGNSVRRRCLTAALIGFVGYELITGVVVLRPPVQVQYPLVVVFFGGAGGPTAFWFIATIVAAIVLIAARARGALPATSTLLALAAFGAATTVLLLAGLPTAWQMWAQGEPLWNALFIAGTIQVALAAAITATASVAAARRIRRLPSPQY